MLQKPDTHTEELLKLADFIEDLPPDRFSMRQWGLTSEPRCICGWYMHNKGRMDKDNWLDAGRMLGMDRDTAGAFFSGDLRYVSAREAAKALRHYAVTGEFNGW